MTFPTEWFNIELGLQAFPYSPEVWVGKRRNSSPSLTAADFYAKIGDCDASIVSFAEHNGSYTAAWKNLFDWTSRINQKVYQQKPMAMRATPPGARGAQTVLASAVRSAPHFAGDVKDSLSAPSFNDNFDTEAGELTNEHLQSQLLAAVGKLT